MHWPSINWKEYTRTERLVSWRFVAMGLAREDDVSECSNEREILDTYAMLALPGTPVEKSIE
jgi:hypothetical protein